MSDVPDEHITDPVDEDELPEWAITDPLIGDEGDESDG